MFREQELDAGGGGAVAAAAAGQAGQRDTQTGARASQTQGEPNIFYLF